MNARDRHSRKTAPQATAPGSGAPAALARLYDEHAARLYAYACVLARSPDEAEDVVQSVFLRLAKRPGRMVGVENPRAYLFRSLRNEVLRQRSRWGRWRRGDAAAGTVHLNGYVTGAEAQFDAEAVERAMAALPPGQREVVFLKVWQEMTFAEIAALLDIPANTAASRYRYALEKLRGLLRNE